MVSRFFPARLKPPPLPKELKSPLELEQELEQQPDIKALVGRLYPEALKAPELIDLPEPEFREITMRALQEMPQPDLEKELRQRGASREDIDQLLPLAVPKQSTEDIVRQLFPLEEPEDVLVEAETDWDKFFAQVKAWGRTPETEQLLTTAGYTPSQIDIIFPPIAPQRIRTYGEMIKARAAGEAPALAPPPSEVLAKYPVAGEGIKEPSALPSLTWIDKVNEIRADPEKLLPFVSSGVEIYTIGRLLTTAKALEAGRTVSEDDLRLLQEYVDRAQRDTTWGYKVFDVIANLVPFAGEFAATGGIYAIGEKASIKAATVALKKISTKAGAEILERRLAQLGVKAVGTVAGGTLRSIPIGATRVPASTLEKQLQHTLTGDEEDVWRSAAKAMGENWIEVVSESTGGLLNVLANPIKGKLMKLAVFKAFQRANPAQSAGDIQKVLDRMGYHGVLAEMFEERVGDVGHGILASVGLGDQPFKLPSLNQLSVELVAFSVPGVVASVLESVPGQEVVAGARKLATEEAGFAALGRGEMAKPMRVGQIATKDIRVLPEKYQYRAGGEKGLDVKHVQQIVDEFNPDYFEPIQVNKVGEKYELLSGHHRLAAWEALQKRGNVPGEIPAIIHEVDEATAKELARVANLGIKQYTPVEKIRVFSDAVKAEETIGKSSEEALASVAARYGAVKPREVQNYLDAAGLPGNILEWLDNPATSLIFKIEHAAVLARAAKKYNYDPVGLPAVVRKLVLEEGMTPGQVERALRTVGEKSQQAGMFEGQMFDFSQKGGILKDLADLNRVSASIEGERRTISQFSNLVKERQKVGAAIPETFSKAAKDAQGEITRLKTRLRELEQGLGKKMALGPEVAIREGVPVEYENLIASLIGKNREDFLIVKETGPLGPSWVVRLKGSAPDEFVYRGTGSKQEAEEALGRLLVRIKEKPAPVPPTPTGMPEAGFQPGALGVAGRAVRPAGGEVTQISMADQLKLAKAREVAPTPAPAVAKEPWQMTREELKQATTIGANAKPTRTEYWVTWNPGFGGSTEKSKRVLSDSWAMKSLSKSEVLIKGRLLRDEIHLRSIKQALSEGKPVPPEVLKDYPELAATMPAAAPRMPVAPAEVAKPTPPMVEVVTPEVTKANLSEELVIEARKYKSAEEFVKEGEYGIRRVRLQDLTPEELTLVRKAGYNTYYKDLYTQYAEGIDYIGLDPSVPSTFPMEIFPTKLKEVKSIPSGLKRGKSYNPSLSSPEKFWVEATKPEAKPVAAPEARVAPPAPAVAKEPWQMTQDEFEKDLLQDYNETAKRLKLPLKIDIGESTMHKWIIEQALSEGKPVPPEVLRDYPELAAKATPVKPVEAIIPQVSKQPWQMTREDITRNKSVANKIKSTVEEDSSGLDFGLRLLPDRKKPYKKGDVLGISYKWIEGKRTRESVGGTSVIKLDAYGVYTEQALERLQRGGYGGDNVALVRGRAIRGGEDEGESIFRNAEIVDVFKKSDLPSEQLSRHKTVIEQALSEGKPVPPEVLKDYPELAATMPAAAPRMTVAPAEVAKPTPPTAEAPVTPEVTPVTKAVTPEVTKPAEAVVRSQEIIKPETVTTKPTTTEVNAKLKLFAQLLASPDLATRREATLELRKIERAKRARNYNERVEELLIEGKSAKEAMEQATKETMSGELPRVTADTISNITKDMTDSFYAKVHEVLAGDAYEEMSTREALTNAILTGDIPREPGVKGGSAYKRLMRVFGEQPEVVKLLDQKKPLRDVMEGVFQEAGRDPVPLDQDILDYLRSLKDVPFGQAQLWFTPLEPSQIVKRSKAETEQELTLLKIELAEQATPLIPFTSRYEAPVDDAIEQIPLWPPTVRDSVIRVLKEMAWSPVDIGGFIKAMKSSVDMSYWRQITPLIPNHKARFAQSNIDAWKALFSQKSAEASWQRIVRDSEDKGLYAIYDALQAKDGRDFLRPLDLAKGTAQWKGVEEFGYLTKERAIPRLTSKIPTIKISNRAFSTGTNSMAWGCFKDFYHAQMRIAEKYASGELKLRPGKTFSIMANMDAYATMLSDWTGRASLGKLSQAAPILGNIFYAPRYALGRVIGPRHLFSANRYVRGEAWKDAAMFIGTIGGAILLGRALGFWDVETDRNSADFMKVRVGHLHLDPWGGAQQFVVFFSRVLDLLTAPITGKKAMARSTITGMQYPLDISNLTENFLKSKQAPLIGLFREYITGKTFGGEKAEWGNLQQWVERLGPMSIQDIIEAYQDKPSMTPVSGALSFVGMGVQTYTGDWKDNIPRLGLPKYEENLAYGVKEPNYNTEDLWADHSSQFKDVDPATITKEKGFPPAIKAIVEARAILDNTQDILKVKLTALNADPNKGTTFVQHYKMWQDRQKLVASGDEAKLKEFDADERTKNAKLGNLTQRQYALLVEYHSITDKKEKAKFLEDNSELDANPYQDWLKSHPKENAQLAVWGKADILTPEAYKETQGLLKELDIPNSAIPDMTLPPKESIEIHFKYLDMVAEGKEGSLEAKLMLALDAREAKKEGRQSYIEWKGLKLSDTPIASLELKVKNHELSDTFASYSDKESPNFLDDTVKDAEGKTARDRAQTKLKADNPDWVDDMNRIEAIEHNGEQYQEQWVEHGKIAGEAPGYNAEEKIWLFENRDVHEWALEQKLTTDTGVNWNIPALRIDAKYRKEDAEYKAILDKYPGRPPEEVQEAKQYLADNEDYRKDVRRREAHKLQTKAGEKFPETEIESYVQYYELEGKGFRQERMLIENYTFAQAMHRIKGKDLPDPAKVPAEPYDDIYDEYKIEFDRLEGLGKFGAPDYEPSTYWREAARKEMRYQAGKLTEFGKAEVRRKGYKALIGMEQYIDDWVQYYSYQDKGFERERFLLKNIGFYRDVWLGRLGNKPVKFSALPEKQPLAILEQAGLLQEYLKKFR